MKPTVKTSGSLCLSLRSAAVGGLPHLPQVSNGVCWGHAAQGPKTGSQAEPQKHSQNLGESLQQEVVWGVVQALLTTSVHH